MACSPLLHVIVLSEMTYHEVKCLMHVFQFRLGNLMSLSDCQRCMVAKKAPGLRGVNFAIRVSKYINSIVCYVHAYVFSSRVAVLHGFGNSHFWLWSLLMPFACAKVVKLWSCCD